MNTEIIKWEQMISSGNNDEYVKKVFEKQNDNYIGYAIIYLFKHNKKVIDKYYKENENNNDMRTIAQMLYDTGLYLLNNGNKNQSIYVLTQIFIISHEYAIIGDHDPYDSAGLIIENEGTDEQKKILYKK